MKNKRRRVKKGPIIILLFIIAIAVCFVMIKPIKKKDGSKKNDTKVSEKSKETKDSKDSKVSKNSKEKKDADPS